MHIFILLFFFWSCEKSSQIKAFDNELVLLSIEPSDFKILYKNSYKWEVNFSQRLKNEPQFFLYSDAKEEEIDLSLAQALKVEKNKNKENVYKIKTNEKLKEGKLYTIFFKESNLEKARAIHSFYVMNKKAKLIHHSLFSEEEENLVPQNINKINLIFDKEIDILSEDSFGLLNIKNQEKINIFSDIFLSSDKTKVDLYIDSTKALLLGDDYALIIEPTVTNKDGLPIEFEPIEFTVGDLQKDFEMIRPLEMGVSHKGFFGTFSLSQDHETEIYYGLEVGLMNCLGEKCPQIFKPKKIKDYKDNSYSYFSMFDLNNLVPNTKYKIIIRSEDNYGNKIITGATFNTLKKTLVISEIMPNTDQAFLEVYNASDAISLNELKISFMNEDGRANKRCQLKSDEGVILPRMGVALIVGKNFNKELFNIDSNVLIHKLTTKTICQGFSSSKPKIITLWKNDEEYFDKYQGPLWPKKEGISIHRINILGLDKNENYCYSNIDFPINPGEVIR